MIDGLDYLPEFPISLALLTVKKEKYVNMWKFDTYLIHFEITQLGQLDIIQKEENMPRAD